MYQITGLNKSFTTPDGELLVLDNISLSLQAGSLIAIVGESGSGKSTLLQILGTLEPPDSGNMLFNNISLGQLHEKELAQLRNQHIGFIYQSHHLIPELTALENVMLPALISGLSQQKASEHAQALLDQLGLSQRAQHIPAHLSGGEAQRVSIARALINQPSLILADEPTGNLDESIACVVFDLMRDLCKTRNIAVIMVTHSRIFAQKCDKIYTLSQHQLHTA